MKRSKIRVFGAFVLVVAAGWLAQSLTTAKDQGRGQEMAGIERLHAKDVAATLADDPKALADLWTDDAVRLNPGDPAEVGKQLISANDEKQKAQHRGLDDSKLRT